MSLGVVPDDAAVVALGGNVPGDYGTSEALLEAALARFAAAGLPILRRSSWWRSAAWPDPSAQEYRNGVVLVEARLEPQALIRTLFMLENQFGRERSVRNAPRTLDLDLIAHGRIVSQAPELTLPHPRAHERAFVLVPWLETDPAAEVPGVGGVAELLAGLDTSGVERVEGVSIHLP